MSKFNSFAIYKDIQEKKQSLYEFYRVQIKILSEFANLSACCRRLGISVQAVHNFINGKDNAISLNKLELLCVFLNELPCGLNDDEIIQLKKDLSLK